MTRATQGYVGAWLCCTLHLHVHEAGGCMALNAGIGTGVLSGACVEDLQAGLKGRPGSLSYFPLECFPCWQWEKWGVRYYTKGKKCPFIHPFLPFPSLPLLRRSEGFSQGYYGKKWCSLIKDFFWKSCSINFELGTYICLYIIYHRKLFIL